MKGLIVKNISNDYTVLANNNLYVCKSRGKLRIEQITPLVGDIVDFDENNNYILSIYKRKNSLVRPPVANIDQVLIVTSCKDPDFSSNLLDKLLVIIEYNKIKPVICFTKLDLLKTNEINRISNIMNYYKSIGYDVYDNNNLDLLKAIFKNKITVFTGQSGAGKSTLLNKLDKNLNLKTDQISHALGRGKHTTRHVELLKVMDGLIADTPGFSAISLNDMSKEDIRDNFIEFNNYKDKCEYRDCMHIHEENCNIRNNISVLSSRYENYIKFIEEKG
ncbi:MAG: ribosome small subunit-dependent GTPase A [Bacilli bacterium]|nr:ribosome small subunit-dependent GTPase A [Bacilli bacterium]